MRILEMFKYKEYQAKIAEQEKVIESFAKAYFEICAQRDKAKKQLVFLQSGHPDASI